VLQVDADHSQPARFATIVRVAFDRNHLYVAFFARDSAGPRGLRVQDLRWKFEYFNNDGVGISLDPRLSTVILLMPFR
jgi:hypothetical protein